MLSPLIVLSIAAALLAVIALWSALFRVPPKTTAIVCRRGHFIRQVGSGIHVKLPWVERVVGTVGHDARIIDVTVIGTQTLDPIAIRLVVAIEYFVLEGRAHDVFFDRSNVSSQIESALGVVVRKTIPSLKLAVLLTSNVEAAASLREQLEHAMRGLGYGLRSVVIVNVDFEGEGANPEVLPTTFGVGWKGSPSLAGAN